MSKNGPRWRLRYRLYRFRAYGLEVSGVFRPWYVEFGVWVGVFCGVLARFRIVYPKF